MRSATSCSGVTHHSCTQVFVLNDRRATAHAKQDKNPVVW